jgi:hypothetical protein
MLMHPHRGLRIHFHAADRVGHLNGARMVVTAVPMVVLRVFHPGLRDIENVARTA